ncbi:hypothetical protein [Amycolatopsis sp. NPDC059657]|uniref:hypothetical protein n=1 Tax=Amycolatopsis sp. NPDC059657 TaxID=3346899 RepID=UPI0036700112
MIPRDNLLAAASVCDPARLLSVRLGARNFRGGRIAMAGWSAGAGLIGILLSIAYQCLQYLPGVRGVEMTESKVLYFIVSAMVVGFWLAIRSREQALGGWYLASLLITFAGGAALAAAMHFTTPAQTYAWSWLGALGWSEVCTAVILVGTWRAPVIAEDKTSEAVDTALRIEDGYLAMPAYFAVPLVLDLLTSNRQPPEFTWWLVAYMVLAVGTSAISALKYLRRMNLTVATPNGPF